MFEAVDGGLWEPGRHAALTPRTWDAAAVRRAIEDIVADTRAGYSPAASWPLHPNDGEPPAQPFGMLYFGAAGVVWALEYLCAEGACEPGETFAGILPDLIEPNRRAMGGLGTATGLLMGDTGILMAQWRAKPAPGVADALATAIAATSHHPALELMWGAPGALLAALALYAQTGEARWADLVRASAVALQAALQVDDELTCRLWTQDLYGSKARRLGAVHGFAGNAFALIKARALAPPGEWDRLSAALAQTLAATAVRADGMVNWPPRVGPPPPAGSAFLMQHCHGAPGMIVGLAGLDQPIDDLLTAAGETVWRAGPLAKGANLCHGTGGNGYAFLELFERTGDALWLDRARRFAMHAIEQSQADAARFGHRRYSLWTGDLGLAAYLWDCLQAQARFPTMAVF
jgi:lantibiotic modifying enzyme